MDDGVGLVAGLRRLAGSATSAVRARRRAAAYRDPQAYWERRHRRMRGTLDGVGTLGLGEAGNARDYEHKWEHLRALLARVGPQPPATALDAGCGVGWFTARIAALGYDVEGVDFSAEAIEQARSLAAGVARWHRSELHELAPGRRYDLVLSIDVLFHVVDDDRWRATLRNLAALTAPGGRLVVQEFLADDGAAEGAAGAAHVRRRTEHDYVEALAGGWRLVERDSYVLPAQRTRKDLLAFAPAEGRR